MSGAMEKMVEDWKSQLPGWQRWIFNILDKLGLYDFGFQIFGFDAWYEKR